jgi:hypothetical protein
MRRVLGDEHPDTLKSANNLASSLSDQGKYAEAERIEREVLGARRRLLGEEHPSTRTGAGNLAMSLAFQGKHAEAEELLQATLAAHRRVIGSAHPDTLATAESLEFVRSQMRVKQPTKKAVKAAAHKERMAAAPPSETALAEADARAGAAEAGAPGGTPSVPTQASCHQQALGWDAPLLYASPVSELQVASPAHGSVEKVSECPAGGVVATSDEALPVALPVVALVNVDETPFVNEPLFPFWKEVCKRVPFEEVKRKLFEEGYETPSDFVNMDADELPTIAAVLTLKPAEIRRFQTFIRERCLVVR